MQTNQLSLEQAPLTPSVNSIPSLKNEKEDNLIQLITTKIFQSSTSCPFPLIPFKIIRLLSIDGASFMKTAMRTRPFKSDLTNDIETITSCINSVYAVALIFMGAKQAKKKFKKLASGHVFSNNYINLPGGKKWNFEMYRLFDGIILHQLNTSNFLALDKKEQSKMICSEMRPYREIFCQYLGEKIADILQMPYETSEEQEKIVSQIQENCKQLDFTFNDLVIGYLRDEICNNIVKVNDEHSFVYLIAIFLPDNKSNVDHGFTIEQFFCSNSQSIRYRLYQSWLNQATLWEDLEKQAANEEDTSWDLEKLKEFLNNLQELYSKTSDLTYEECFGYPNQKFVPLLMLQDFSFNSLSFRYLSVEVQPKQAITNLADFISKNPEFKSQFLNL